MRNVFASFSTFIISCVFLVGCKTPELEVGSLGKVLPAPALKGANPLDQDNEGYGLFEGTCDTRISSLYVSFDKQLWSVPKATPTVTDTNLPAGTSNDINCADGTFKFYLTKVDILAQWGIDIGDDSVDVNAIYMKGATAIGDTGLLEMRKTKQNGGNVTTVVIQKVSTPGFTGASQCAAFDLVAKTADGFSNSVSVATSVVLKESVNNAAFTNGAFYSDASCATTATSTFSIPAKSSHLRVYYRFSDILIDQIDGYKFKAEAASLAAQVTPTGVTVRNLDHHYLTLYANEVRVLANTCIPVTADYQRYDGSYPYILTDSMTVVTSDSKLKFYGTDSTCTTKPSGNNFSYSGSSKVFFVKYVEMANTTSPMVNLQISVTSSATADLLPLTLQFDRSGKTDVKKLDIWMPEVIGRGTCEKIQLVAGNEHRTPVTLTTDQVAQLNTNGDGEFYADDSCSTPANIFTIPSGVSRIAAYYKAFPPTATADHVITGSLSGLNNSEMKRNISVVGKPSKISLQLEVFDSSTGYGQFITQQCQKVKRTVRLTDSQGGIFYPNNFGFFLPFNTVPYNLSGVTFYENESDCLNSTNSSPHSYSILPINASEMVDYFYMRVPSMQTALHMNIVYPLATPGVSLTGIMTSLILNMP